MQRLTQPAETEYYSVRTDPNLYKERYELAWKNRSTDEMLMLVRAREDVADHFKKEERRVFPWMTQARTMSDIALNVLSFWLVEDSTSHRSQSRAMVLERHFLTLHSIVNKIKDLSYFPLILESLISEDQETFEAAIVFLHLVSTSTQVSGILAAIEMRSEAAEENSCMLDDVLEMLIFFMQDEEKSPHVRIRAIATLCNLSCVLDFEVKESKIEDIMSDCTLPLMNLGDESEDEKESKISTTYRSMAPKMNSIFKTYNEEKLNVKDVINRELSSLISELNQTNAAWRERKEITNRKFSGKEKSYYLRQTVDNWEVAELIKAILRFYGVQEAQRLLNIKAFQDFFASKEMDLGRLFRSIKRDLDIEMKILIRQEELKRNKAASPSPQIRVPSPISEDRSVVHSLVGAGDKSGLDKSYLSQTSFEIVKKHLKKQREIHGHSKPFNQSFNYSRSESFGIANRLSLQQSLIRGSSRKASRSAAPSSIPSASKCPRCTIF